MRPMIKVKKSTINGLGVDNDLLRRALINVEDGIQELGLHNPFESRVSLQPSFVLI